MPTVTSGFVTGRRIHFINITPVSGQAYAYTMIVTYAQVSIANTMIFLPFLYVRLHLQQWLGVAELFFAILKVEWVYASNKTTNGKEALNSEDALSNHYRKHTLS